MPTDAPLYIAWGVWQGARVSALVRADSLAGIAMEADRLYPGINLAGWHRL